MQTAELYSSPINAPKTIAIIGGGISALTLVHHIFQLNNHTKVSLFCRDQELANRGSGNKQGAIYPLLQGSKSNIAELFSLSYEYALNYYQKCLSLGLDVEHGFTGVLQQAIKPELESRLKKVAKVWPHHCDYLNVEQSDKIAGIPLGFPSLFFSQGGWIYPKQFCQKLAESLTANFNLSIQLNCEIKKLEKAEQCWHLISEHQEFTHFDAVVICSGHLTPTLQQSGHIPIQSVRGQVSQLSAKTELSKLQTVLCHKGYVTPSQGQYQCFGATFIKDSQDENVNDADQASNLNQLRTVYAHQAWSSPIREQDIVGNNAAIRAMSPDHLPIVGELFSNSWIKNNVDQNTGNYVD